MQRNLCERVLKLDKNIRFVGIVNNRGEVIEGGFQQGIQLLLNGQAEQQIYNQALSNVVALREHSDRLGNFRCSITEHDKVFLITFPRRDDTLCVSALTNANPTKIRECSYIS